MLRELCTLLACLWWWTDRCPKESKDRNKKLVIFRSSLDLRKRDSRKITCIWGILLGMILIWRIQSFRFILSHVNPTSFSGNFYDVPAWLFVIRYKEKVLFLLNKSSFYTIEVIFHNLEISKTTIWRNGTGIPQETCHFLKFSKLTATRAGYPISISFTCPNSKRFLGLRGARTALPATSLRFPEMKQCQEMRKWEITRNSVEMAWVGRER